MPPGRTSGFTRVAEAGADSRQRARARSRTGLGGSARLLATLGCGVDCVELSPDDCAGAALLNRLTGLDLIDVHHASALDLPLADGSFDVIWMQTVGMNIADKRKLYGEIHRVLEPGGRYVFQEMVAGEAATSPCFPLPWATDPGDSFLLSAEETRSVLGESGFIAELFEDTSDAHLSRGTVDSGPSPLTWGSTSTISRERPKTRGAASRRATSGSSEVSSG
ncbi:MAG TPA: class I SAM-dependent methyltransferase [Thermoanaerobaculia bacterium]|nr:class I SAM-dependent methyltransferase [Thermoanaerobaculia bacterium]